MSKSKVYFCRTINQEKLLELYKLIEKELPNNTLQGNVAVKVHSGEKGNQNYLHPEFFEDIINYVNGTVVECNTAYEGKRLRSKDHLETLKLHGWDQFKLDLLDEEGPDLKLEIKEGKTIKENYVGKNIEKYDSMLVLSHFKGHPMGGYGGALKQLSIGLASSYGKAYIHGAGEVEKIWTQKHDMFLEAMADASKSIVDYFNGNIVYINVMKNMSVDCDCCSVAEDPCIKDKGILISLDPVAIDKACIDLVYSSDDEGKDHFIERVESRNGTYTIKCAEELNVGTSNYELFEID